MSAIVAAGALISAAGSENKHRQRGEKLSEAKKAARNGGVWPASVAASASAFSYRGGRYLWLSEKLAGEKYGEKRINGENLGGEKWRKA
jgi:hypothetical protein